MDSDRPATTCTAGQPSVTAGDLFTGILETPWQEFKAEFVRGAAGVGRRLTLRGYRAPLAGRRVADAGDGRYP